MAGESLIQLSMSIDNQVLVFQNHRIGCIVNWMHYMRKTTFSQIRSLYSMVALASMAVRVTVCGSCGKINVVFASKNSGIK